MTRRKPRPPTALVAATVAIDAAVDGRDAPGWELTAAGLAELVLAGLEEAGFALVRLDLQ